MLTMRTRLELLGVAICCASLADVAAQVQAPNAASTPNRTLTAVAGIRVGHHTLSERPTGCTVILVDGDAVGGVSQRGGAPGTRETDLLNPLNMVDKVNAVVLSGGSAFGLDAAGGVMKWLEERGVGWQTAAGRVPIVTGAVLYDLGVGDNPSVRPTADCGFTGHRPQRTRQPSRKAASAPARRHGGKDGRAPGRRATAHQGGIGSAVVTLPMASSSRRLRPSMPGATSSTQRPGGSSPDCAIRMGHSPTFAKYYERARRRTAGDRARTRPSRSSRPTRCCPRSTSTASP
jgi:hypothetical protein